MDVLLPTSGSYVIAVSGGVDSMALLHVLNQQAKKPGNNIRLTVAHLDHGIRQDSQDDRELVQAKSGEYGIPFVYKTINLGAGASEDEARQARYEFLNEVRQATGAKALITAHHQDDVLETAILNLLRGTGRKGLTSLGSRHDLHRPLLDTPKSAVIAYAKDQGLTWNEDSTNVNLDYQRNYIRHKIIPRIDSQGRQKFLELINNLRFINQQIDTLLVNQLHLQECSGKIDRSWFNQLPHTVAREVMATWLRDQGVRDFDSKTIERLVVAAKVGQSGKTFDVMNGLRLSLDTKFLALKGAER